MHRVRSSRVPLAYHHKLTLAVHAEAARAIEGWYRAKGKTHGIEHGMTGSITVVQRFGNDLALNVHFHSLFLDGVQSGLRFVPIDAPTASEMETLCRTIARRTARMLDRRAVDHDVPEERALARALSRSARRQGATPHRLENADSDDDGSAGSGKLKARAERASPASCFARASRRSWHPMSRATTPARRREARRARRRRGADRARGSGPRGPGCVVFRKPRRRPQESAGKLVPAHRRPLERAVGSPPAGVDLPAAIADTARVSEPDDVTRQVTAMRFSLGCGVTLAAGVLTTVAAVGGLIVARLYSPTLPAPVHCGWAFVVGWVLFLVAAPAVGAAAVVSPRVDRALEASAKRMGVGCAVPAVMAVVATVGSLALILLDSVLHPGAARPSDYGQGLGILLMLFCLATPFVGVVAAFFPRVGIALGVMLELAFFGAMVAAIF